MNRNLAVVGSPIAHSKSPDIHSAAYRVLGVEWNYSKTEVARNQLAQFVKSLDSSWLGLSVTAPLKYEALRLSTDQDSSVAGTGVANTLLRVDDGWKAFNTDIFGIVQTLRLAMDRQPSRVSILGTGATAKSAIVAVSQIYPNVKLTICGRNSADLKELAIFAGTLGLRTKSTKYFIRGFVEQDLVISTLPSGALDGYLEKPLSRLLVQPHGVFFDVAYEPWPSSVAKLWLTADKKAISGIEMLLWQAIGQIRIFTSGDLMQELPNEGAVFLAMRHSVGLI